MATPYSPQAQHVLGDAGRCQGGINLSPLLSPPIKYAYADAPQSLELGQKLKTTSKKDTIAKLVTAGASADWAKIASWIEISPDQPAVAYDEEGEPVGDDETKRLWKFDTYVADLAAKGGITLPPDVMPKPAEEVFICRCDSCAWRIHF